MEIHLTRGKIAVIDDADAALVQGHSWCARRYADAHAVRWYAASRIKGEVVYLHRLILGVGRGDPAVDHKDGDGLNNRRSNLRFATASQNGANSTGWTAGRRSRFKGVHREKRRGLWFAHITVAGKTIRQYAQTEEEAARLYNELARQYFGDFARCNTEVGNAS